MITRIRKRLLDIPAEPDPLRRRISMTLGTSPLLIAAPSVAAPTPPGLFAGADDLARARARRDPAGLGAFLNRTRRATAAPPPPFTAAEPMALRFGWLEETAPPGTTLRQAVDMLQAGSAVMRDLALGFALTGRKDFARRAMELMADWARRHTVVNFYDFNPDFARATHDGATRGFESARPWNFGLDSMWQCYGLINAADAWLLLGAHGGRPESADAALIEAWLLRLVEGVNAGFHAWTRWADANGGNAAHFHNAMPAPARSGESAAYERHRSDNHLSWSLAGLLAGAAALGDRRLADYALDGGSWRDRRAGAYANPSPITAVVDRAIEIGEDGPGRIYEERIGRTPRIGYALFHLEAMSLAARIAGLHFGRDVWRTTGADGVGMLDAFRRYAPYLEGVRTSPDPRESDGVRARWLFALSPQGFGGADRPRLLAARALAHSMSHAIGPAALLFGRPPAP